MSQVSYGTITITDTNDIERIYTVYAKSNTNTDVPTAAASSWTELISEAPGNGNYIWQRTVVEKSGTEEKTYSDPVCLTGEEGADGRGITSIVVKYGTSANWDTQPSNWYDNTPEYSSSTPNYWTQTTINYTTGNPDIKTTQDQALTDAIYNAIMANSIATHANENSQGAMSIATTTQIAQEALATKLKYIWTDEIEDTTTPAGSYMASGINGTTFNTQDPTTYGFNSQARHTRVAFRYNAIDLTTIGIDGVKINVPIINNSNTVINSAKGVELTSGALKFYHAPTISGSTVTDGSLAVELTNSALNFYRPGTNTIDAQLTSSGLVLSKGGIRVNPVGSNNGVYISSDNLGSSVESLVPTSGGTSKTNWRAVIGSKFGVDSEGNLYANNAHLSNAEVEGAIIATSLTIGSGASVNGLNTSDITGINNYALKTYADTQANNAEANASYSLEIKITAIDYTNNSATLVAVPYYQGSTTLPTLPSGMTYSYQWYIDGSAISGASGPTATTLSLNSGSNLAANYSCVISKEGVS